MRLLNTTNLEIREFVDGKIPKYAILSHTWDEEEVTFQDVEKARGYYKKGYEKLRQCCFRAKTDHFDYLWIDTCCIDKSSSAELSEAINSMYLWYYNAERCYAYLADVPSKSTIPGSKWFKRGWTLQELIAPSEVYFLDGYWNELGTKKSLKTIVSDITGIPVSILLGHADLETASIAERMSWAANRETTRLEDRAYSLMGIFGIYMPLIYGEGGRAFIRLQEEIMRISDDHSLFAWRSSDDRGGLLATSPAAFARSNNIIRFNPFGTFNSPSTMSSTGVHLELCFMGKGPGGLGLAVLHCKERGVGGKPIAIYLRDLLLTMERFERVLCEDFEEIDLKKFRSSQYPKRRMCIKIGRTTPVRKFQELGKYDNIAREIYDDNKLTKVMKFGDPSALICAAKDGLLDDVWLLLTRSDICVDNASERMPLSWAAENGHEAIVKLLLELGADTESKDKWGSTALSYAAMRGHKDVVELLVEKGADFESRDSHDMTALLYAATKGHKAVVEALCDMGADIESADFKKKTALFHAAKGGHKAVVELLLDKGADIESVDFKKKTALFHAARGGHEAVVELLLDKGAGIESVDFKNRTALFHAAKEGHEAVVKLLLEKAADLMDDGSNDFYGRNPLMWAKQNVHMSVMELLQHAKDKRT